MLAIVTSFRSIALSADWPHDAWLLDRAIESALAQTVADVIVLVACHEVPPSAFSAHPKVRFLPVPFARPARNNDDMCADKVAKLSHGIGHAISLGCSHVMITDADDLVHRGAAALARDHPDAPGWYADVEYFYAYGGRWLRRWDLPGGQAGPCAIFRVDMLRFDTPPYSGAWLDFLAGEERYAALLASRGQRTCTIVAAGLAHYRAFAARDGHPLRPLPFPGNVVICHSDSTSHVPGGSGSRFGEPGRPPARARWLEALRGLRRHWRALRRLTPQIAADFSVLEPASVPSRYRNRGSIF